VFFSAAPRLCVRPAVFRNSSTAGVDPNTRKR
jgi:hypothetical protein